MKFPDICYRVKLGSLEGSVINTLNLLSYGNWFLKAWPRDPGTIFTRKGCMQVYDVDAARPNRSVTNIKY